MPRCEHNPLHRMPPPPPPDAAHLPRRWIGLAGIGTGIFMFTLDGSIVNVALPTLVTELHTSFATVQWIVLAYLLVVSSLVLGAARMGDLHGKKRIYLCGLGLFTAASLGCALSPDVRWLIAMRAVQGLGGVFVAALGAAIIAEIFPPKERGRALGFVGTSVLLGVALGPTLGGLILHYATWHWMFLVNIPIGIAVIAVLGRVLPRTAGAHGAGFDWPGTVLLAAGLVSLALAFTYGQRHGFATGRVLGLFAVAGAGIVSFLMWQRRAASPLIDLRLFGNTQLAGGLSACLLAFVVIGGNTFILPFFLQLVGGFEAAQLGLLLAIAPVVGGITAPMSGLLADRIGTRWVTALGACSVALGCFLLATLDENVTALSFGLRVAFVGFGTGMFNAANNTAVLNSVKRENLGVVSGLLSLMRTLGQSIGVPMAATIFGLLALGHAGASDMHALLGLPPASLVHGTRWVFVAAGLVALSAAVVTAIAKRREKRARRV
jgi:EmrB/QacA subfamily drug resistance transporter